MDHYPATYKDVHGIESTTISNDGETLSMPIRGITFTGLDFDSLEAPADTDPQQLSQYWLNDNCLCCCRIECQIPIPISDHGKQAQGVLFVEIVLELNKVRSMIRWRSTHVRLCVRATESDSIVADGV